MPSFPKLSYEQLLHLTKLTGGVAALVLVALFISGTPSNSRLAAAVVCSGGTTCTTSSTHLSLTLAGTGLTNNGDGSVSASTGQTFTLTWPTPTGGVQDGTNINCWGNGTTCNTPSQTFTGGDSPRLSTSFSDGTFSYFAGAFGGDNVTKVWRWLAGSQCFGDATTCGNTYQSIPGVYPQQPYTFTVGTDMYMVIANQLAAWGPNAVSYIYKWIPAQYAEGSVPISASTGGASNTSVDRSWQVDNSSVVTKIGAYSNSAVTITVKIVLRNSTNNYNVVVSQSCSHPGGGWYDCTLTTPYTVPATGTYYAGVYSVGNLGMTNATVSKSVSSGDKTGTNQTITETVATTPVVRVTYQTALSNNGCWGDGTQCAATSAVIIGENAFQAIGNHTDSPLQSSFTSVTISGTSYLMLSNQFYPNQDINSRVFTFKWMPSANGGRGCFGDGVATCANSTFGTGYYDLIGVDNAHKVTTFTTGGGYYLIAPAISNTLPVYIFKWVTSGTNCPTGGGWGDGAGNCAVWNVRNATYYQAFPQWNTETVTVLPIGSDLYFLPGMLGSTTTSIYKWISSGTNCPSSGGLGSDNGGTSVCATSSGGGVFQTIGVDNTSGMIAQGGWNGLTPPFGSVKWDSVQSGGDTYVSESYSGYIYKWMPSGGALGKGCFGNGTTCANATSGANVLTTLGGAQNTYAGYNVSNLYLNGSPSIVLMAPNRINTPYSFNVFKPVPGGVLPACTLYQKAASAGSFSSIATADSTTTGVTVTPTENTDYKLECNLTGNTIENTTISLHLSPLPTATTTATDNTATEAAGNTGTFTITRSADGTVPPSQPVITTFNSSTSWTVPAGVTSVEVLVVGGGGAGGGGTGAGGGGGGVIQNSSYAVTSGSSITVTVGAGGVGVGNNRGGNGGNSAFGSLVAVGGGGGGSNITGFNGANGGSGGGASDSTGTAGLGTSGQGNNGGVATNWSGFYGAAGGGGAGSAGSNGNSAAAGAGGIGISSSISGTATYYGGGGGGGTYLGGTAGAGGLGGGGNGGSSAAGAPTAGAANTGGGGGGQKDNLATPGASGGSGVVIVKYTPGGGGSVTPVVTTFNSNTSWTVPAGVTSVEVLVVGGGGGGGSRHGGGGGGGGVVSNAAYAVTPGASIPLTVGAGGQAGWYNGGVVNYGCTGAGGPGGNSTFGTITAKGGGGGKTYDACTYVAGGSGGGGGGQGSSQSGGTATAGQGNVGGIGDPNYPGGGGGGGAGVIGGNYYDDFLGSNGGNGGNGIANSITGSSVIYAGGGGGGADSGAVGGTGGTGGGGHGGDNGGNTNQTAGTAGLGGGGGGTRSVATTEAGSPGGAGVVIVKYTPPTGGTGGLPTTIFLTSTTTNSWTVPADWVSTNNTVEVIGGGGAGGNGGASTGGSGGGGAAYSKSVNIALTPGAAVSYSIGSAGFQVGGPCCIAQQGGDSWFNASSFAACTNSATCVSAKGGAGGTTNTGGAGGAAASGVGVVKYSGGTGVNKSGAGAASGGGGAAGPHGDGNPSTAGVGGAGGTGGAGDAGFGGAGGVWVDTPASPGGAGTEYDATHGSGGGGSSVFAGGGVPGGNGGNYGGGGGGGGTSSQGGKAMSGLIVITYTQAPAAPTYSALDLSYTLSGVAVNGTDYQTITSPIHFNNGEVFKTITVTPIQDNIFEGPETVVLTVNPGASYVVGSPSSSTVTITDDETSASLPPGVFDTCTTAGGTCELGISPPTRVRKGNVVTLSWSVTGLVAGANGNNGDTCSITSSPSITAPGFPPAFAIDSNNSWLGSAVNIPVNQQTVVTLRCVAPDGVTSKSTSRTIQLVPNVQEI
jgi:hypothetical protein